MAYLSPSEQCVANLEISSVGQHVRDFGGVDVHPFANCVPDSFPRGCWDQATTPELTAHFEEPMEAV